MRSSRRSNSGFTLLEALLASVVVALIAIPAMTAFSQAAQQSGGRLTRFDNYDFAYSLLEERIATGNFELETGVYEERFAFNVRSEPYMKNANTRFDEMLSFIEIIISVQSTAEPRDRVTVSQIVAQAKQ